MFGIIDNDYFSNVNIKTSIRSFTIATVATATPNKNYGRLLDLADEAKRRGLDVKFIVAGRVNKNHQGYL